MVEKECTISSLKFIESSRLQCMHGCMHYKRNPMCPPNCPDVLWFNKVLKSYDKLKIVYELIHFNDSTDLTIKRNIFNKSVLEIEQRLKKEGNFFALGFISGACTMCEDKACRSEQCSRVLVGRASVCATGIDLMAICKDLLQHSTADSLSFWKANLSWEFFDKTSQGYLCLGLVFY